MRENCTFGNIFYTLRHDFNIAVYALITWLGWTSAAPASKCFLLQVKEFAQANAVLATSFLGGLLIGAST